MTTNESAPDPTAGERACLICRRPEHEHRDRNGHGFAPTPATPPADAASEPVTEADDAKAHAARIGASYGRELADRDSDDGNDPVERVRGRRVTEPDLDWNASTEASNDHWTCGGCGYEGNGPDNVEWIEHTKVCPAEKHGKAMPADDASTDASEPLTEAERHILNNPLTGFGASLCGPEPVYAAVERIKAAAATKARAEGHRDGYEMARSDMVSGAFVGGPTYEALRDSFTGQRIITDERERIAQAIESEQKQRLWPRILDFGDGMLRAARIARGDA